MILAALLLQAGTPALDADTQQAIEAYAADPADGVPLPAPPPEEPQQRHIRLLGETMARIEQAQAEAEAARQARLNKGPLPFAAEPAPPIQLNAPPPFPPTIMPPAPRGRWGQYMDMPEPAPARMARAPAPPTPLHPLAALGWLAGAGCLLTLGYLAIRRPATLRHYWNATMQTVRQRIALSFSLGAGIAILDWRVLDRLQLGPFWERTHNQGWIFMLGIGVMLMAIYHWIARSSDG